MRAHGCGERGCPSAAPCSEALEHLAFDDHLLAAELEEVILVLAKLWRDKERANHINRLINSNNVVFSVNLSLAQTKVIFPWVPK